jgi:hypothetical protein
LRLGFLLFSKNLINFGQETLLWKNPSCVSQNHIFQFDQNSPVEIKATACLPACLPACVGSNLRQTDVGIQQGFVTSVVGYLQVMCMMMMLMMIMILGLASTSCCCCCTCITWSASFLT